MQEQDGEGSEGRPSVWALRSFSHWPQAGSPSLEQEWITYLVVSLLPRPPGSSEASRA